MKFFITKFLGLVVGTMPEFQQDAHNASLYHLMHRYNQNGDTSSKFDSSDDFKKKFPSFIYRATDNPATFIVVIEYICMAWFTMDYLVRLIFYHLFHFFTTFTIVSIRCNITESKKVE